MKRVGNNWYIHVDYLHDMDLPVDSLEDAMCLARADDCTYVKYNTRTRAYTFVWCEGWETLPEPVVRCALTVLDCSVSVREYNGDNAPIIHGKHLFVGKDYRGFDWEEAKARWDSYQGQPWLDKRRMGYLKWWQENAIPILDENT